MKKMLLVLSVFILALSFHIKEADAKSRSSSGSRTSSSYSSSSSSKSSSGTSYNSSRTSSSSSYSSNSSSYRSGVKSYKPNSSTTSKKTVTNVITNSTTNKAKVSDKATSTTEKNKIVLKKSTTGTNQKKKNSVSNSLKKLNYTGPVPNKSKFLYTALGAYLLYQYTEDDGEPVYADVETGDEIEMDDVDDYDYKEVESVPDDVDVDSDLVDDVDELEKHIQQLATDNKNEDNTSDKHPIIDNILFLISVLIPTIGLILIGRMFFKLIFMK
ncbi:hypothetical protein ABEX78_23525 [Priestia megaterium]